MSWKRSKGNDDGRRREEEVPGGCAAFKTCALGHALDYKFGNFLRTLATPEPIKELVADEPEGEFDQDRREDRQPRALGHLPNG
jgi:hypothetical protein